MQIRKIERKEGEVGPDQFQVVYFVNGQQADKVVDETTARLLAVAVDYGRGSKAAEIRVALGMPG
jgi:hypothetical protein